MGEVLRERRRTRGAVALGIVASGVSLAWLIGRPDPPRESGGPEAGDRIVLRRRAESPASPSAVDLRPRRSTDPAALNIAPFPVSPHATVAIAGDTPDVPPTLAKSFPSADVETSARWGVSMGIGMSGAGTVGQSARTHRIVNGDSLPALAKRYLGSEDRANEIFEANRDLLSSPDALPIGFELRIPAADGAKDGAKATAGSTALVPIAPRGSRGGAPRRMNSE